MSMLILLFGLLGLGGFAKSEGIFDVTKYGAKADGVFINTESFRKAIEAAEAAGGGTVLIPKGPSFYFTGPIHLKSNLTLELQDGAYVKFSDNFEDYLPMNVRVRLSGSDILNFSPLIYGWKVSHVAIKGNGTFDGSGKKWWDYFWTLRRVHEATGVWPTNSSWHKLFEDANADLIKKHPNLKQPGFYRPALFRAVYSDHVTVEGVTFKDSPWFVVTAQASDRVLIDGIRVTCPANAPNTDGIHPESCTNIVIRNSVVDTGDDGIVFTATPDRSGGHRPTENVTVHDCTVYQGHGGIVIGSGISGGIRNFEAYNLHFDGTLRGIRIKSVRDHGGLVENISLHSITMRNISHEGITINAAYVDLPERAFDAHTPIVRNVHIWNVTGDSAQGIQVIGLPEKHFEEIVLENVTMVAKEAMISRFVDGLERTNFNYSIDPHLYEKKSGGGFFRK